MLAALVSEYEGNYRSFRFAEDASKILNYVQGVIDAVEEDR